MSGKKKNRNIISLPPTSITVQSNESQMGPIQGQCINKDERKTPIISLSTNTTDLEDILDLSIKISGLSSSSSLSWSEEYEGEITKKVQFELEKLDRIFQGAVEEEDSTAYDVKEIREWKCYFPHLYILGHTTPTNSAENSSASSSEDEIDEILPPHRPTMFSRNRSSLLNKQHDITTLHQIRNYNSLPRKPSRSLDIDKYLKISSIKSPDSRKMKQTPPTHHPSQELPIIMSPDYTSLPFITATPLKTQIRRRQHCHQQGLILPPISSSSFRSISATPRQASSKSMFGCLNSDLRNSSNKRTQAARLKSDLMKLFEHIPISNR